MIEISAVRLMRASRWGAGLVLVLAASGCCGGGSSSADNGSSSPPAAPRAVVAAPDNADGSPRRGIVRSAPNFKASEVNRLDNGTAIAIDEQLAGGWLRVHWPYPRGSSTGFIHQDVVAK